MTAILISCFSGGLRKVSQGFRCGVVARELCPVDFLGRARNRPSITSSGRDNCSSIPERGLHVDQESGRILVRASSLFGEPLRSTEINPSEFLLNATTMSET